MEWPYCERSMEWPHFDRLDGMALRISCKRRWHGLTVSAPITWPREYIFLVTSLNSSFYANLPPFRQF